MGKGREFSIIWFRHPRCYGQCQIMVLLPTGPGAPLSSPSSRSTPGSNEPGSQSPEISDLDLSGPSIPRAPGLPDGMEQRPRPDLEDLLTRADELARTLRIRDPRGHLLQVALMRRDRTLLEAVVHSVNLRLKESNDRPSVPLAAHQRPTVRPARL